VKIIYIFFLIIFGIAMKMSCFSVFIGLLILLSIFKVSFVNVSPNNIFSVSKHVFYYEMLQVQVWINGSISVWVDSQVSASFLDISDFSRGLETSLLRIAKSNANFIVSYNLEKVSLEEADIYAKLFCEKWISILNGHYTLKSRNQQSFYTSYGKKYTYVNYEYVISDIDIEKAVSLFLKSKPENGFLMLINKNNIKTFTELRFELSRDEASNLFYRIEYYRRFPYFNYKVGRSYTLDIFKLFNYTGPLIINSQSFLSIIDILLKIPPNLDFIVTEAKIPPQISVMKRSHTARYSEIEITNGLVMNFKPGEKITELNIKFKAVEKGFQMSSTAVQIIGIIFIMIPIVIIGLILYRRQYYGKTNIKR